MSPRPQFLFCASFTPRTDVGGSTGSLHTPPPSTPSIAATLCTREVAGVTLTAWDKV